MISFQLIKSNKKCLSPVSFDQIQRNKKFTGLPENLSCIKPNAFEPKGNGKFWLNYSPTKLSGNFDPSLKNNQNFMGIGILISQNYWERINSWLSLLKQEIEQDKKIIIGIDDGSITEDPDAAKVVDE